MALIHAPAKCNSHRLDGVANFVAERSQIQESGFELCLASEVSTRELWQGVTNTTTLGIALMLSHKISRYLVLFHTSRYAVRTGVATRPQERAYNHFDGALLIMISYFLLSY